ncbi:uncharacterized protein DUF3306 [Plasticicumulans lactativorans]|uniref:Uncharacterized protein DUF3306 n=1 Tax=Plasticicumulans lactativorans TaxID=1133106 RepID=A0A4R2L3I7_9GAMM|nr:DUF3306 domain-containing protein [Plasticicumulans lactativorans]TCO80943.1 uncharacterized protein DUF3306 [Plasticicumulans lactativorans]
MNPPDHRPSWLLRWAERKARARAGQAAGADVPVAAGEQAAVDAAPQPPVPELPELESLGPDSDFRPFLDRRVDAALRRLALRRLFSQPAFNAGDGLDTYIDDCTAFTPLGEVITADMRHLAEVEARRLAATVSAPTPGGAPSAGAPVPVGADGDGPDLAGTDVASPAADTTAPVADVDVVEGRG